MPETSPSPLPFGYWGSPPYDSPEQLRDPTWDAAERAEVLRRMDLAIPVEFWLGWANCRICGCRNGSLCLALGPEWIFPEGLAHYIRDHELRPPPEFVAYVLSLPEERLTELALHQANKRLICERAQSEAERARVYEALVKQGFILPDYYKPKEAS